jgi:hypothetical protein
MLSTIALLHGADRSRTLAQSALPAADQRTARPARRRVKDILTSR